MPDVTVIRLAGEQPERRPTRSQIAGAMLKEAAILAASYPDISLAPPAVRRKVLALRDEAARLLA